MTLDPLDLYRRFRLAYRYADVGEKRILAFYHYNKLIHQDDRYPNALNNLALLMSDLDIPAKGVAMLQRAKRFEEPFPQGNLAIMLAKAGFLDEGVQILEGLSPEKRLETRAADAAGFIGRRRTEEQDRLGKVSAASEMIHKVYSKAADALGSAMETGSLLGEWKGSSGEKLSLNELSGTDRVLGTLIAVGGSEGELRLQKIESLLTGTATSKTGGLLTRWEEKLVLVVECNERLEGIIAKDETSLRRVIFER